MFTGLAKFRRLELRHSVPHWLEAAHSNDNPRGRCRPTGRRRPLQPVLACHWIIVDGSRLECRWGENFDEISIEEPGGRQIKVSTCLIVFSESNGPPASQLSLRCSSASHSSPRFIEGRNDSERTGYCRTTIERRCSVLPAAIG